MKNERLTIYIIIGVIMAVTATAAGCDSPTPRKARHIMPDGVEIMAGDVVLRKGTGMTSHIVTMADKSSDYSHCGIAADSAGKIVIIHAVPDEHEFDGDVDRVRAESPESFFSLIKASKGCILRCKDTTTAKRSAETALRVYRRHTLFDHDYNDRDTSRMYCSELVEYAYSKSGMALTEEEDRHDIHLPGLSFRHVIFPSDFLKSPHLELKAYFEGR